MGKSQRTKGAVFEREVAAEFSSAFAPHEFKRHIGQARDGGNDLDVGCLVVECKRRASLKVLRMWMQQATAAVSMRPVEKVTRHATHATLDLMQRFPIVVMREDGGKEPMVLVGFSDFLTLAGDKIAASL